MGDLQKRLAGKEPPPIDNSPEGRAYVKACLAVAAKIAAKGLIADEWEPDDRDPANGFETHAPLGSVWLSGSGLGRAESYGSERQPFRSVPIRLPIRQFKGAHLMRRKTPFVPVVGSKWKCGLTGLEFIVASAPVYSDVRGGPVIQVSWLGPKIYTDFRGPYGEVAADRFPNDRVEMIDATEAKP